MTSADKFWKQYPMPEPRPWVGRRTPESEVPTLVQPTDRPYNPVLPGWGVHERGCSYEHVVDYVAIALKFIQGSHFNWGDDIWKIWFPLSWHKMEVGTKVFNESTGAVYTIKDVDNKYAGLYLLTGGPNVLPPQRNDILYFEDKGQIRFRVGYPTSEDPNNQYFTQEEIQKRREDPWTDTITYRITRAEHAGVEDYFVGRRQRAAQRHGRVGTDETTGHPIELQFQYFDVEIQFDCWSQTNERAVQFKEWFRYCMKFIIPAIRRNGVDKMNFQMQKADTHLTRWRNDIVARSLIYRARVPEGQLSDPLANAPWNIYLDALRVKIAQYNESGDGEIGVKYRTPRE